MSNKISDYLVEPIHDGVKVTKNGKKITAFTQVPKEVIEQVAKLKDFYLYGETSMVNGKHIYKVSKVVKEAGGVVNYLTTESKSKYNKFIIEYKG